MKQVTIPPSSKMDRGSISSSAQQRGGSKSGKMSIQRDAGAIQSSSRTDATAGEPRGKSVEWKGDFGSQVGGGGLGACVKDHLASNFTGDHGGHCLSLLRFCLGALKTQ